MHNSLQFAQADSHAQIKPGPTTRFGRELFFWPPAHNMSRLISELDILERDSAIDSLTSNLMVKIIGRPFSIAGAGVAISASCRAMFYDTSSVSLQSRTNEPPVQWRRWLVVVASDWLDD